MTTSNPYVTIVLPCYNESGNLRRIYEALRPLLATNPCVEAILVDNGSTDGSQDIARKAGVAPSDIVVHFVAPGVDAAS